jgi:hypothetical protein
LTPPSHFFLDINQLNLDFLKSVGDLSPAGGHLKDVLLVLLEHFSVLGHHFLKFSFNAVVVSGVDEVILEEHKLVHFVLSFIVLASFELE